MITNKAKILFITMILAIALVNCSQDPNNENKSPHVTTPSRPSQTPVPTNPDEPSSSNAPSKKESRKSVEKKSDVLIQYIDAGKTSFSDLKAEFLQSKDVLQVKDAVILPSIVPNEIEITITSNEPSLLNGDIIFKGNAAASGGGKFETPTSAFELRRDLDKVQIHFSIKDLRRYLSDDREDLVTFAIQIFSKSLDTNSLQTFIFTIGTPPSLVEVISYPSVIRFENDTHSNLKHYRYVKLKDGQNFYMFTVLQIINKEARAIKLKLPFQLHGNLTLEERTTSVSTQECSYSTSTSSHSSIVGRNFRLIPLDSGFDQTLKLLEEKGSIETSLMKNQKMEIGIYAPINDMLSSPVSTTTQVSVPTSCKAQCIDGAEADWAFEWRWGKDCVECGRAAENKGESCFRCMRAHPEWCRWKRWKEWKDSTDVQQGSVYGLYLAPETEPATSTMGVSFLNQVSTYARILKILDHTVRID